MLEAWKSLGGLLRSQHCCRDWAYGPGNELVGGFSSFIVLSSSWRVLFSSERQHDMATVILVLWTGNHLYWIHLGGSLKVRMLQSRPWTIEWGFWSTTLRITGEVGRTDLWIQQPVFTSPLSPVNSPNLREHYFLICKARWAAIVFQDWVEAQAVCQLWYSLPILAISCELSFLHLEGVIQSYFIYT